MSSLSRLLSVPLGGVMALAAACGSDSSGPKGTPGSITGVAGDGQSAPTGTTLPIPLSFVVLDAGGSPLAGATVNWTVVTGSASVSPPSSTTNSSGAASTTVTMGGLVGPVIVRGTVTGITPVDFHLDAVDPCFYDAPYTLGSTINGALTANDCFVNPGYRYDFYGITVGAQQGITATMTSTFDTYLEVYKAPRAFVGFNDDISSTNSNSLVQVILAPGSYALAASTAFTNVTGSYTLTSANRAQTVAGCEVVWVTRGVTLNETIAATDCPDSIGGGLGYADAVGIFAASGSVLKLTERSTEVNAMLTLYRVDSIFNLEASNDDSATGTTTNAFISYPVSQTSVYVVFIGTAAPSETGAYTFEVSASTTLSGAAAGAAAEPLLFVPLRLPKKWQPVPGQRRRD